MTLLKFGIRWMVLQWEMPLIALGMAVIALIGHARLRHAHAGVDSQVKRLGVAAVVALALGSELAYPLYTYIGVMEKIQFPFRFMPMGALLASLALLLLLAKGGWQSSGKYLRTAILLVVAGQLAMALGLQWNLYRYAKPMPATAQFMSGRFGQNEYLLAVRGPHWEAYIDNGKLAGECTRLGIRCQEEAVRRTHAFAATIDTQRDVAVRLPIFAYPAWGVRVDGQSRPLVADRDTGLVQVTVPAGRHVAEVDWVGLPAERVGNGITLGALAVLLGMLGMRWRLAGRRGLSAREAGMKSIH